MRSLLLLLGLVSALIPLRAHAQTADVTEKTVCAQALGYFVLDDLKRDLLFEAKRMAVNELFGEMIVATTEVENQILTTDQILASSMGLIRLEGSVSYFNGENLAEVCVTIKAYVTVQDKEKFAPLPLSKRVCVTDEDLTTRQLIQLSKDRAVLDAVIDYDRRLESIDPFIARQLLKRVEYSESGFVPETETYCTRVEGYVTPIEVVSLVEVVGSGVPVFDGEEQDATIAQPNADSIALSTLRTIPFASPSKWSELSSAFRWDPGTQNVSSYGMVPLTGRVQINTVTENLPLTDSRTSPKLIVPVSGDFDVQVRVSTVLTRNLQFAGLGVQSPEATYQWARVNMGRVYGNSIIGVWSTTNNGYVVENSSTPYEDESVYLRMRRSGEQFEFFYSTDGSKWTQLDNVVYPQIPDSADVFLFVSSGNRGFGTQAEFSDFKAGLNQ